MVSRTLVIKAHKKQLPHMFCLRFRGLFCSAKDFYFVVFLLSAISILVSCKQCAVNEVQSRCEFEACGPYRDDSDFPKLIDGHRLQNACHSSNTFCFSSTLSGFEDDKISAESEAVYEKSNNLSHLPPYHGNFRFLGGSNISCTLYREDDISTCVSPLFDKTISVGPTELVEFSVSDDGLSTPPVEINPLLLDWGHKNIYHPSLGYLTVRNLDADRVLTVYDPYSNDSQFYPCNFSAVSLAPGENASICFVFFPTNLGSISAKLIVQTSFGGFLIRAKGFSLESPYLINPLRSLEISSSGRWRKKLTLFNPFDEALRVNELTSWISTSSGNTAQNTKLICRAHGMDYSSDHDMLSAKDWLTVKRGEGGKPQISLRPHNNWVIGPKKRETIMELDISGRFEGKVVGAFCLQLLRSQNNEVDMVMVPLETELSPKAVSDDKGLVSLSLETVVPCNNTSGSIGVVALSVRNDALYSLRVIEVARVGENIETFQIKPFEGLVVFPGTVTQVAFINYARLESREVSGDCRIIVLTNNTRFSEIKIPCVDVIGVCSGRGLDSSVGFNRGINVDYVDGDRLFSSSMLPSSGIEIANTTETDELILRNWKSQAKLSTMSILDKNELLFPTVLVGNYSSQYITIKNPSPQPVVIQLILNSAQLIDNCRRPEPLLQPSSSNTLVGNSSIAPTRYGFSIPKDATTEAFIHPNGTANLGPILFQPPNRCEWRSSALIRNNLSGVEWLSLQAFGGSLSLVLHEGYDIVQSLEFNLNLPTRLNFSSPVKKDSHCSQFLKKEVYAENTGDLPVEIIRIKVSGAECGLDGFIVNNCAGSRFSLQPGEFKRLRLSYQTDFTAATVHRDLELVLATGILVIPMKASMPRVYLNFCRRSIFWTRVKKSTLVLLFSASLVYFIFSLLFPDFKTIFPEKNSGGAIFQQTIAQDEALVLECCDGGKGNNIIPSAGAVSSPSSVLNVDMQDTFESRDLRVRVGKEKGRRRRKKNKGSGVEALLFEASSSQSGNSTPSSPLSPVTCTTPKRPQPVEARNPFSRAPIERIGTYKPSKTPSKVNEVPLKREIDKVCSSAPEKLVLTRKAVVVPLSGGGAHQAWTCRSSLLASTSTIAPHARAPGTRLGSQEKGGIEEKKIGVAKQENYTYDIWGDHLFGLHFAAYQSKKVSSRNSSPFENDSESFFVRGPQTLVKNALLHSVISDLEVNE
ncbi:transmembrane protein 131-like [Phtheirospermum japonicum]|uniref:Transmembrane protein 131-like n=1 Tax=Phtheirospermum japonicum TaxID=374723 RepID=A0A830CM74_9LAMI|nr:transmembrane protein 131-like [Phtheirospermum japonicum]